MKKDTYRSIEITAVFLTVVGKIVRDICKEKELKIAAAVIAAAVIGFWIVYLFIRVCKEEGIGKEWGFTCKKFKPAMKWAGIVGGILICGFITYGLVVNHTKFSRNILISVVVYPVWGLAQQFLFISLIAGNLKNFQRIKFNEFQIVAFTSILFCFVHFPNPCLMIPTFFMAIFFAMMFLKYKNIYPLAIFHGVVGAVFYYFVLNEDPLAEMIAEICIRICT